MATLADSPVVSCLSLLSTLSVSLEPDLGSNTYLNGFRYLNMNCAWNIPKHVAGTASTEEYLLVRYIVLIFFFFFFKWLILLFAWKCLRPQQHYYSWLVWNQWKRCRLIKQMINEHSDNIVYQQDNFFVTYIPSVTCNDAAHSAGFDLIYLTVRQVKSRWNQRDFTWIRLPLSHKEQMFIFCPLCVLTVGKLRVKHKLWTRDIWYSFAVYICLFHTSSPSLNYAKVFMIQFTTWQGC